MENWSLLWLQCHRKTFWCNLFFSRSYVCFGGVFFLVGLLWLFGVFWLERFDKSDTRLWVILIKCNIWFRQNPAPLSKEWKISGVRMNMREGRAHKNFANTSNLFVVQGLPNPEVMSVCQDIPSLWLSPGSPGTPITFWHPQHPETGTSTAEPGLGFEPAICPFFFLQRKTEWAVDSLWLSPWHLSWF